MVADLRGYDDVRRAYSYIRFSCLLQSKGNSERRQLEFAERMAEKLGAVLDESLSLRDLGVSAFRSKNAEVGALKEFLDAVETGRVSRGSILIVENIDRLSRNKVGIALQLFISLLNQGITIVTAEPERVYHQDSINDVASLLEPIIYMSRAHEESRIKSMRVRKAWGEKKRRAVSSGKPLTAMTPAWVELTQDGYRLIPQRAATVRSIFKMAAEGMGAFRIVQALCADPVRFPPFGRSGKWNVMYVNRILSSRSVYGEHQSYAADPESGKKNPDGEPIPGFFPAAVTSKDFYVARASILSRKSKSGRPPVGERNLFTGIVRDAVGRSSMFMRSMVHNSNGKSRRYSYLTSAVYSQGDKVGGSGHFSHAIGYDNFERAVLACISELTPSDVMDRRADADDLAESIRGDTEELIGIDHKLRMLQERAAAAKPNALPLILDMIEQAAEAKKEVAHRLELRKSEAANGMPETLGETQSLISLLRNAVGGEAETLRRRLKSRLRLLIDSIHIVVEKRGYNRRTAHIKIYLRSGDCRYVRVASTNSPGVIEGADLRPFDFRSLDLAKLETFLSKAKNAN